MNNELKIIGTEEEESKSIMLNTVFVFSYADLTQNCDVHVNICSASVNYMHSVRSKVQKEQKKK